MSAWVVSQEHIAAMVGSAMARRTAWLAPEEPYPNEQTHEAGRPWGGDALTARQRRHREATDETATEVARLLLLENTRSVAYRYDLPDPIDLDVTHQTAAKCRAAALAFLNQPIAILKAIACFEYQSCEHPEWPDSEAQAFCDALRKDLIIELPGYDDAPWGIYAETIAALA